VLKPVKIVQMTFDFKPLEHFDFALPRMNLLERITITPDVRSGKPCITGTRITVYDILEYLAGGMSETETLEDFPSLTQDDLWLLRSF
jgi:uncharacterized protein (DUF433 family)